LAARASGSSSSSAVERRAAGAFRRRVLSVVARIPVGRVITYGDVARLAGAPGAARAVGNILREARVPGLPYHRVIAAGGQLGGYSDLRLKRQLLVAEGLEVGPRRVLKFADVRWTGRR
jgi:methylated-DNA-protein-cysteine methyltransferase-like protein